MNDDFIPEGMDLDELLAAEAMPSTPAAPQSAIADENSSVSEPEAQLPDGIGLSLEEVRALLAKKHETVISKDDPVLLLLTIFNALLAETDKLHTRHGKALTRILSDKTESYVKEVQNVTESLSESLSAASLEAIRIIFDQHSARMDSFRSSMTWAAAIVGTSALVNVTVFVFLAVVR